MHTCVHKSSYCSNIQYVVMAALSEKWYGLCQLASMTSYSGQQTVLCQNTSPAPWKITHPLENTVCAITIMGNHIFICIDFLRIKDV